MCKLARAWNKTITAHVKAPLVQPVLFFLSFPNRTFYQQNFIVKIDVKVHLALRLGICLHTMFKTAKTLFFFQNGAFS